MAPPGVPFDPSRDIPDLSGKVIVLTGGTAGIGAQALKYLAGHNPSKIIFTGRNEAAAQKLQEALKSTSLTTTSPSSTNPSTSKTEIHFIKCDQSSLSSVKAAASQIKDKTERIDMLFCNAGVMALPPGLTEDGFEIQFGINHMAHALLINLLLPLLKPSPQHPGHAPRIILTTSIAILSSPPLHLANCKTPNRWLIPGPIGPLGRYCISKLCNVLYASELARRYPEIPCVSVHPGSIQTGLVTGASWGARALIRVGANTANRLSEEEGAWNMLWAACADVAVGVGGKGKDGEEGAGVVNGAYYEPVGVPGRGTKQSEDVDLAGELWAWTQKELEKWF